MSYEEDSNEDLTFDEILEILEEHLLDEIDYQELDFED